MIEAFNPLTDGYSSQARETVLVGPPGTGKTFAVLQAWLLPALRDIEAREILACSFTKAAALEMRSRVERDVELDEKALKRLCSTIHSEAYYLDRLAGGPTGIWKNSMVKRRKKLSQLIAEADGISAPDDDDCLEDLWENKGIPIKDDLLAEAQRIWDLARHLYPEDVQSGKVETLIDRGLRFTDSAFDHAELVAEIKKFEADKQAAGCIDFTDMLLHALWSGAAPTRRLLIVDEAQDLSPLQIRLIEQWATRADKLAWIGDPDQGIYEFSGADGRHLTELIRSGRVMVRSLQRSFRVPEGIHGLARSCIRMNQDRVDASYFPADRQGYVFEMNSVGKAAGYAEDLAQSGTVFILARSCRRLAEYAEPLTSSGIPFVNERGSSPLKATKLCNLLLAVDGLLNCGLVSAAEMRALVDSIPGRPKNSLLLGKKKDSQAAVKALDPEGSLNIQQVRDCGINVDVLLALGSLEDVLEHIGMLEKAHPVLLIVEHAGGNLSPLRQPPKITLTTMHGSKGREADSVILDLEAPYPTLKAIRAARAGALEAERRLLYVAITRAKSNLLLVRGVRDLVELLGVAVQ